MEELSMTSDHEVQSRKIRVPLHRFRPLKKEWRNIYDLVSENMKINIRMNLKTRFVELKTRPEDHNSQRLMKCGDFVRAFILGFGVDDAKTLLQNNDVYVLYFEFTDKNKLKSLGYCKQIQDVESSTKTSIVIEGHKFHILGTFSGINAATNAICHLILESSTGIVDSNPTLTSKL
ncbi:RNA-binding protein pno1 [Bienertia sinuspersici]